MNSESQISKAKQLVQDINLDAEFIYHEKSGKTTEDAEIALGIDSSNIIKTLILYDSKNLMYVGAIILGDCKLDVKKLIAISGAKKLSFASDTQISELTGFQIGGVPPLAIRDCGKRYIDNRVLKREFVIGAGGNEFCGLKFSPKEFISKCDIEIGDVAV